MTAETAEHEDVAPQDSLPDEPVKDVEAILPPLGTVVLEGVTCGVRRLKTREFFSLMAILTGGLGPAMGNMGFGEAQSAEDFQSLVLAGMIMAIPQQQDQFLRFVQDIVEPQGSEGERRSIRAYLDNPEIEDLLPIVDAIVAQEAEHFASLMGKARAYIARWVETIQNRQTATNRPA